MDDAFVGLVEAADGEREERRVSASFSPIRDSADSSTKRACRFFAIPSAILVTFALPTLLMLVFAFALSLDQHTYRSASCSKSDGAEAQELAAAFSATRFFDVTPQHAIDAKWRRAWCPAN